MAFLHGIRIQEVDSGTRPISAPSSSIIGLVGTASGATFSKPASISQAGWTITTLKDGKIWNDFRVEIIVGADQKAEVKFDDDKKLITFYPLTDDKGAIDATMTEKYFVDHINANPVINKLVIATLKPTSQGNDLVKPLSSINGQLSGGVDPYVTPYEPKIVNSGNDADKYGTDGTIPKAFRAIFSQTGAVIITVTVPDGKTEAETKANIIKGIKALEGAESVTGIEPRILVAPGFTNDKAVLTSFISIAESLRGWVIADGTNTNMSDAINYGKSFDSKRVFLVDPWVKAFDEQTATYNIEPPSAYAAGIISQVHQKQNYAVSPSNKVINGIVGTARPIPFKMGDENSEANLLNSGNVASIINYQGLRLWGNRTLSSDPKWAFLQTVIVADQLHEALQRSCLWAVDRNITKTYIESVVDSVNAFIRDLIKQQILLGGECWADPELNSPENLQAGKVYFDIKFTPVGVAEQVTFRSNMTNEYFSTVVA